MNSAATETFAILEQVATALTKLELPYFVGGSLASSVHGEFRATQDIDIILALTSPSIKPFVQIFTNDFYVDEIAISNAVSSSRSFNMIHKQSFLKVDFFTRLGDFEKMQLERAVSVLVGAGQNVRFATPEDTILAKLLWFKKGNEQSERQWRDVLGVWHMNQTRLDRAYLKKWSTLIGVESLYSRLCETAAGSPL